MSTPSSISTKVFCTQSDVNLFNSKPAEPGIVEQKLGAVRKSFQDVFKQFDDYKGAITNTIDTGYAHSKGKITV